MVIDFSGTAGQVRRAFHTEIHHLDVKGEKHIANISNPQIPAALGSLVVGIVSLHDFSPRAMHQMHQTRHEFTFPNPLGGASFALVPADLATIYNLNPLFNAGNSGWRFTMDTTKLSNARHRLTVRAQDISGLRTEIGSVDFYVQNTTSVP